MIDFGASLHNDARRDPARSWWVRVEKSVMGIHRRWLRLLMGLGAVMMVLSITIGSGGSATAEYDECVTQTPTTVPAHTTTSTPDTGSDQAGGIAPSNSVLAFQQNT